MGLWEYQAYQSFRSEARIRFLDTTRLPTAGPESRCFADEPGEKTKKVFHLQTSSFIRIDSAADKAAKSISW